MIELTWSQVHAWRLAQHGLAPRFPSQDILQAVTRTGGIQAQVMSAAELALCTRVEGLAPSDVRSALWEERRLVKTWAMRGTLHLLSVRDLPLYVAARDWQHSGTWSNYFAEFDLSRAQQEAYLAAIPSVLAEGPLTRVQLADAVAKHTGVSRTRDFILSSSWGTPLKPSAYRGELCFGPGQGQSATFMTPKGWLATEETGQAIAPQLALQEMARRYLGAYGPATADDFRFWWGCGKTPAKQVFRALQDELEDVEVEGWRAAALRSTIPVIQSAAPAERILLLPLFDAYTIGVPRDCEPLLAPVYKRRVFNLQGWTFAVILVNGSIQGVWHTTVQRTHTLVKVSLFSPSTAMIRQGIDAEAARLSSFFGKHVTVEYEDTLSGVNVHRSPAH